MRLRLAVVVAALACAAAAGAGGPSPSEDVRAAAELYEATHPAPFHAVTRARYRAAVASLERRAGTLTPNQLLVELMRLGALPGVRDGHGGIYPLDSAHSRMLHLLPIRLYRFPEGVHVVAEVGRRGLVGDRVVSIAGVPVEQALRRIRPLVPADNEWSRDARALQWLLVTEVLNGLGLADAAGRQTLVLAKRGAGRRTVQLDPVPRSRWAAAFPDLFHPLVVPALPRRAAPAFLSRRDRPWHTELLANGRVAYAAYNVTDDSSELARELGRLAARPAVNRVVLDLRLNPGGNLFTYAPLLALLRGPSVDRPGRLYVLVGRSTFSAAALLATELDRTTGAIFVGEPTGGSPDVYADPAAQNLPVSGWNFLVATKYWQMARPRDSRLAIAPELRATMSLADFIAGRDPVLARALR
jgi:Peptidase family S41